jgi:hypothetical protein
MPQNVPQCPNLFTTATRWPAPPPLTFSPPPLSHVCQISKRTQTPLSSSVCIRVDP